MEFWTAICLLAVLLPMGVLLLVVAPALALVGPQWWRAAILVGLPLALAVALGVWLWWLCA